MTPIPQTTRPTSNIPIDAKPTRNVVKMLGTQMSFAMKKLSKTLAWPSTSK